MSDPTPLEQQLEPMPFFADFTAAELGALVALSESVCVPGGAAVVRQDQSGDAMYFLVEGAVRVIHRSGGRSFELATLGPGEFFGELALIDDGPRSADVEAVGDCHLLRVSQAAVSALAGVYPSAAFKLLVAVGRMLVARMRQGNRRYIDSLVVLSQERD
jgi:CRP-like cAMP-binding protein